MTSGRLDSALSGSIEDEVTINMKHSQISLEEQRLLRAAQQQVAGHGQKGATQRLEEELAALLPGVMWATHRSWPAQFITLPLDPSGRRTDGIVWRVVLHAQDARAQPIGVDISGDVILGRGGDPAYLPDLDLDRFGAIERGVSRRHAMLRPSPTKLYLLDLQSTNGTQCNSIKLGPGMAHVITHNDTITIGTLTFQIKIVDSPVMLHNRPATSDLPPIHPFA